MSPGLIKMWYALTSMGFMFIAVLFIYLSRYKTKGILKGILAFIAYFLMILAGIIILFVVLSGPVHE